MMAMPVKVPFITTFILVWTWLTPLIGYTQAVNDSATAVDSSTLDGVRAMVEARSKLPLRLPTFLPDTGGQKIYALLRHVDTNSYDILLATKVPCDGGNACSYGTVQAQKSAFEVPEGKPTDITLDGGIKGQFFPSECHVFCSEAYVRWRENGNFYSVGVKAGRKAGLLRAVKSGLAQH